MYRQTLSRIKNLSDRLPDPVRAEKTMCELLSCSVKMCKRVLTRNVISRIVRNGVCTNDVESCVKIVCKRNEHNQRRKKKIRNFLMKDKLEDAEKDLAKSKSIFHCKIVEYQNTVPPGSAVDISFRSIMTMENEKTWKTGKINNSKKVEHLKKKYYPTHMNREPKIREIMYRDSDLEEISRNARTTEENGPRIYGGAQVGDNAIQVLKKDPNFMVLSGVDETEVEVEIEKGMTKARYEWMSKGDTEDGEEGTTNEEHGNQENQGDLREKRLNYANLRATDIPTVPRLHPPKPGTLKQEKHIGNLKEKLMDTVREYKNLHCNNQGKFKENNLTKSETEGIKEIKKKIKDKEIVVFATDKSGRFSVDTPQNYEEAVMAHTTNDMEINCERVKRIEGKLNQHMRVFNKMFRVGSNHEHEDRVNAATTSTNTPPPPLYGLRKDHKPTDDMTKGPPVRPVCGANQAPNSRLSNFLSRIINEYADSANIRTECRSSEEMKAAFEEYNEIDAEVRKECCVISMDVKALYPSMEWKEIITSVREMVETSEQEIENVDWHEVGKYLAITLTGEEIEKEGLRKVVPMRKVETGRCIGVAYLCDKRNDEKWMSARSPGSRQKRKMLAIAIAEGVKVCLENHVYTLGDVIFLQSAGGPIGLELTGAVSRPFMARWDRLYLEKVRKAGGEIMLFERYVDDSNQIGKAPPKGAKYDRATERIVVDQNIAEENTEPDERMARVLVDIANSIVECIKMEADWPSKNEDKRLPILDMKVWTDEEGTALYSHYEKPVTRKTVLHSRSAHPASCKRSVHTQEVLRRVLNCSRRLDWNEEAAPTVTEYMRRMRDAGYTERYRKDVLKQALSIYDKKLADEREETRPVYRPKGYKREERWKQKELKRFNWAKKGGGVAPSYS